MKFRPFLTANCYSGSRNSSIADCLPKSRPQGLVKLQKVRNDMHTVAVRNALKQMCVFFLGISYLSSANDAQSWEKTTFQTYFIMYKSMSNPNHILPFTSRLLQWPFEKVIVKEHYPKPFYFPVPTPTSPCTNATDFSGTYI